MEILSFPVLKRCVDLLQENFTPYDNKLEEQADDELKWCLVKNGHLKHDPKFSQMYELDKNNRTILLQFLTEKNYLI